MNALKCLILPIVLPLTGRVGFIPKITEMMFTENLKIAHSLHCITGNVLTPSLSSATNVTVHTFKCNFSDSRSAGSSNVL